jgi:hypothetical protein
VRHVDLRQQGLGGRHGDPAQLVTLARIGQHRVVDDLPQVGNDPVVDQVRIGALHVSGLLGRDGLRNEEDAAKEPDQVEVMVGADEHRLGLVLVAQHLVPDHGVVAEDRVAAFDVVVVARPVLVDQVVDGLDGRQVELADHVEDRRGGGAGVDARVVRPQFGHRPLAVERPLHAVVAADQRRIQLVLGPVEIVGRDVGFMLQLEKVAA